MSASRYASLDQSLVEAYSGAQPLELNDAIRAWNPDDPYGYRDAVVDRVASITGDRDGGYKISLTRTKDQAALGSTAPAYGRLLRSRILPSGTRIGLSAENGLLLEPELVIEAMTELSPAMSDTELERGVRVAAGIEIPTSRFRDWMPGSAGGGHNVRSHILDNAVAGYLVVGAFRSAEGLPWGDIGVSLERDGRVIATGSSSDVMGSPLAALRWLLKELDERRNTLTVGSLVSTGTLADPKPALSGHYTAAFDLVGPVQVTFDS